MHNNCSIRSALRTRLLCLAFALLCAACAGKSAHSAISWVATLEFASDCWLGHRVPSHFVHATVKAAKKEFEKASKELGDARAHELVQSADALDHAIERGDRTAVARERQRFAKAYAELKK